MKHWIILLVSICSIEEIKTAECRVSCTYIGYYSGRYDKENCFCYDVKSYDVMVKNKRVTILGNKLKTPVKKYSWEL